MLNENIKNLRKNRGMTQEELAVRLNVVRQTVSKWEKGLSVPDAEMLQKIAEVLDTSVTELLDAKPAEAPQMDPVAQQLARISEQMAIKNRRAKRFWAVVLVILGLLVALYVLNFAAAVYYSANPHMEVEVIDHEGEEESEMIL
ncbi:MAG: helix-turn-helix transcriptional regulator [Oscillospiraceae bacterium]|nr:helix-turn-helix transcriptional regulator [Oscillospiraceae bacterium]